MNALILAAGLGTRMNELTINTPKPLLQINKKPLIKYALDLVRELNIKKIFVNGHYKSIQIKDYCQKESVYFSDESEQLLNTGGGIKKVLDQLDDDLIVFNSDNIWNKELVDNINQAIYQFQKQKKLIMLLYSKREQNSFDIFVDKNNQISYPSHKFNSSYIGCQIIKKKALYKFPKIFKIQEYWKYASSKKSMIGHECDFLPQHLGRKSEFQNYLKNCNQP